MKLSVIPITNASGWNACLERIACYDIYHTHLYHTLDVEKDARLLVFEEDNHEMALPLLFRDIPSAPGWKDVTSVYGYVGWICSRPKFTPLLFELLTEYMREQKVVSVFSRLHPLVPYSDSFDVGEVVSVNTTVGIDLSLSPDDQFRAYKESVRRSIRKGYKQGAQVRQAESLTDLQSFIQVYHTAMHRLNASANYFFSDIYFKTLWNNSSFESVVLLAEWNGEVIGGAMFTLCRGIMQYHLGGVVESYVHLSPLKLLIDEARKIAVVRGCQFFHLGGGFGGQNDNLFVFKSRMATSRYTFKALKWIVAPKKYRSLSENKEVSDFFPLYRV